MQSNLITKLTVGVLACAAWLASAHAQNYLLTVNLSNLTNVTITATGNFASVNDSTKSSYDGVSLVNFFTASVDDGAIYSTESISGTLTGGSTAHAYDQAVADALTSSNYVDLLLFNFDFDPQNFSTTSAAFTGSATLDLSSAAHDLPAAGTSGNIYAGYSNGDPDNLGPIIGQWEVVTTPTPEPGVLALAGLGLIAGAMLRRK